MAELCLENSVLFVSLLKGWKTEGSVINNMLKCVHCLNILTFLFFLRGDQFIFLFSWLKYRKNTWSACKIIIHVFQLQRGNVCFPTAAKKWSTSCTQCFIDKKRSTAPEILFLFLRSVLTPNYLFLYHQQHCVRFLPSVCIACRITR